MNKTKTEPLPFQHIGIWTIINVFKGRGLLGDDMGLGKTLSSLYSALPLCRKRPIIVACPNTVKWGWEEQVKLHTTLTCWVLEGMKPPRRMPMKVPPIIILNWEILDAWQTKLSRLRPSVIIGDEIQAIMNRRALRTKAFKRLCKGVPFVIPMSGTPIKNRPKEFYNILNILRPDLFPTWQSFGWRYCNPKITPYGIDYDGASNVKELNQLLRKHVMIRRTFDKVLPDLPPLRREIVPLPIDMKKYELAEKDIIRYLHTFKPDEVWKGKNALHHLTKLEYLMQATAELKLPEVIKWIKNFLQSTDRKLAVFGYHRKFLDTLYEEFSDQAVLVYGKIKGRKRQEAIDAFAANPNIRLFFGGITAAGQGINKLTVASDLAIGELVWVPADLLQVEKRIHRMGQTQKCVIHYLVARNTAEDKLCRALIRKQKVLNELLDGKSTSKEFNILRPILKSLRSK